jgi:uncharacterized protein
VARYRFRFHGELNGFLPPALRDREFEHSAGDTDTLKHVIESLGVPHTEVARTDVEGETVDVWPHQPPVPLDEARFVLDGHLGRLAAYLRMLGFDVRYDRFADDAVLARICREERRVLLTRDVGLLKRRDVEQGCFVRAHKPHDQLRDVIQRYGLAGRIAPFTRCMDCNGELVRVAKAEVEDALPPHTRQTKTEFSRCVECGKVYWKGSHHAAMLNVVRETVGER